MGLRKSVLLLDTGESSQNHIFDPKEESTFSTMVMHLKIYYLFVLYLKLSTQQIFVFCFFLENINLALKPFHSLNQCNSLSKSLKWTKYSCDVFITEETKISISNSLKVEPESFPCSSVSKESACSAGDPGLIPGSGRSPGEGNDKPLQYSCLENPMDREAWHATVHGSQELDTIYQLNHHHN